MILNASVALLLSEITRFLSASISHTNLERFKKKCGTRASCVDGESNTDWSGRNCFCDQQCATYGDCCPDSKYFNSIEQRRGAASFTCLGLTEFEAGGIYMKISCPPDWDDQQTREACETVRAMENDGLLAIPVTSRTTRVTYRNSYCALCHGDLDVNSLQPMVECSTIYEDLPYSELRSYWRSWLNNNICVIRFAPPKNSRIEVRSCLPGLIKTCKADWTDAAVRKRCDEYTLVVWHCNLAYKNSDCLKCNNVEFRDWSCELKIESRNDTDVFLHQSLKVLFEMDDGSVEGREPPCNDNELYDPYFAKCQAVRYGLKQRFGKLFLRKNKPAYGDNDLEEEPNGNIAYSTSNSTDDVEACPKFVLDKEDYVMQNDTNVYVPQYKRVFKEGEYVIRDDDRLEVCVGSLRIKLVDKFGIYMAYATYIGLGISIVSLILHLTAIALLSDVKKLSDKNLASLCVSLLIAYTAFMTGQILEGTPCFITAVTTYYFFLASFSWMLTIAFDVWRVIRLSTSELKLCQGEQWIRFAIYSGWSWLAPGVIVAAAVAVEASPKITILSAWRPEFAVTLCWFGNKKALWLFFAGPATLIMVCNLVFFSSSALMIHSSTSTNIAASASTQRHFRFVRLAILLGLTWCMGIAAGTTNVTIVWYIFIALNSSHGLFIFLAFTCTNKAVRRKFKINSTAI